jgi:hypothetical protein
MFAGPETGAIQEGAAEIAGYDVYAERCEPAGELSISTSEFQNSLTWLSG